MRHHQHAGLVGQLRSGSEELHPHPDAQRDDAVVAWFPIMDPAGRDVDALEGLTCVPTRAGAMRITAVPHVVEHLALGDEVAVADWEGEPMARGELALALDGTVRCVAAQGQGWLHLARLIDDAAGGIGSCWFDAIGEHALAASVPRRALAPVFAALSASENAGELRWQYVTPERHARADG
ncbi:MAG: hypothetical protein KDC46_09215 [Thermoleophilia bacterium]|nr:hypothetical protein [Thermoleophilia bacterium]